MQQCVNELYFGLLQGECSECVEVLAQVQLRGGASQGSDAQGLHEAEEDLQYSSV